MAKVSGGVLLLATSLAGCGRVGYDLVAGGTPPDMTVDAPDMACVLGPWEAPTTLVIAGSETATLFGGPTPTADRRTIYFSMILAGGNEDLYRATRADVESSSFAGLVSVDELNSPSVDAAPFLTADELAVYFFSERSGSGFADREIYVATRGSPTGAFGMPVPVPNINDIDIDQVACLTPDELTIVWSSTRAGTMNTDLFLGTRTTEAGTFDDIRRLDEIRTSGRDTGGSISTDGLTLFYARPAGGDGMNIWEATRPDAASNFGNATQISAVNTTDDEFDVRLSLDEREMFFVVQSGSTTSLWHSLRHCL
jgi:hypothetical protein